MSANVSKCQQVSANVSKCQQTSANVSTLVDFVLEKFFLVSKCQQPSATVSKCQQMSATVSKCQQLSANVSKCQQNDDDAGISNLAPARHGTDMVFASGQRVFVLQSRLSVYCRTFLQLLRPGLELLEPGVRGLGFVSAYLYILDTVLPFTAHS